MNLSNNVGLAISIISVGVAIWQTIRNYNIKKYIKTEAMELYTDTDMLRGAAQECLRELQSGNYSLGIQHAGIVEGISHALFTRSVRNIYHHFNYKRKDIDDWIENKRIHERHKSDFLRYPSK